VPVKKHRSYIALDTCLADRPKMELNAGVPIGVMVNLSHQTLPYAFRESSFAPAVLLKHGRKFPPGFFEIIRLR
jgi:hypothetical protein